MSITVGHRIRLHDVPGDYVITHIDWDNAVVTLHQRNGLEWVPPAIRAPFTSIMEVCIKNKQQIIIEDSNMPNMPQPIDPCDVLILWDGRKVGVVNRNPLTVNPVRFSKDKLDGNSILFANADGGEVIDKSDVMCRTMQRCEVFRRVWRDVV